MQPEISITGRLIGPGHKPLVIAEIGINHEGDYAKAVRMIEDAAAVGCECVKFQCHIVDDEMIYNEVVPGNATETIWNMMHRCALSEEEEMKLKALAESKGMLFLSTPFSRAAADRLNAMDVAAFKIGSGECNNTPLIEHIADFGKPVILSTGMNTMDSVARSVKILQRRHVPFALLHCTSVYPTPYDLGRLDAITDLIEQFPASPIGFSDHSIGNHLCFGAVALKATIIEKHFTSDKNWPGPDIPISIGPDELADLIQGTEAVWLARGGRKEVLAEEQPCIRFAYASVVSIQDIEPGEPLSKDNIWVKRPGTGEIPAADYEQVLGRVAKQFIPVGSQLKWENIEK